MKVGVVMVVGGPTSEGELRTVSVDVPWSLFKLGGKKICEMYADAVIKQISGVEEMILIGELKETRFEEICKELHMKTPSVNVSYIKQSPKEGKGTYLVNAIEKLKSKYDTICYMDVTYFSKLSSLKKFMEFHTTNNSQISLLCVNSRVESPIIIKNETNEVIEITDRKTESNELVSTSIYIINSSVYDNIKRIYNELSNRKIINIDTNKHIFPILSRRVKFRCYSDPEKDGFLVTVNIPQKILPAVTSYLLESSKNIEKLYSKFTINSLVSIGSRTIIGNCSSIGPNVVIGDNVNINECVCIKNSYIGDNVIIGANSCIINSIIFPETQIGPWARIEGLLESNPTKKLTNNGIKNNSVSILGKNVLISNETVVYNSIVFPGASIEEDIHSEIII